MIFNGNNKKIHLGRTFKVWWKEGRPAYVAYNGKVYDVTDAYLWIDGNHFYEHDAGKDLTDRMAASPHGDRVVETMKLVGVLVE